MDEDPGLGPPLGPSGGDDGLFGSAPTPPPPSRGPSLAEEEAAMKSGRGPMIAFGVFVVIAALAALGWFISTSQPSPYGMIGQQINRMKADHFDRFWACSLPQARLREITNNTGLKEQINTRASRDPRAYAQLVREQCMVHLSEHQPALEQLIPPEDLLPKMTNLMNALNHLKTAWDNYLAHLEHLDGDYEEEAANPLLNEIARAWFEYKRAHGEINSAIREHVTE